jgi:iron complex transport system substrate-binding protein
MRTWFGLAVVALLGLALGGCGGDSEDAGADTTPGGGFPVTIEHEYGSTTIEAEPTRVVSVGYNDQDAILALGVALVGVREWYGGKPDATWDWAQDELGDAHPVVLASEELQLERIAALRPDLIVGIYAGLTADEYRALSAIAPTISDSGEHPDYTTPWQEQIRTIGTALGRSDRAEEVVADVEGRIAAVREEHPELAGASGLVATYYDGNYGGYTAGDPRGRFLDALGLVVPPEVQEVAGESFYAAFSGERIPLLDVDALLWVSAPDGVTGNPLYERLDVAKEGRSIFLGEETTLSGALSFSTALSIPLLLDELVPRMLVALDGDPATVPEPVT